LQARILKIPHFFFLFFFDFRNDFVTFSLPAAN